MQMKQNVLLTGGTGFIGSHVAEYFTSKNINITCLVRKTSNTGFLNKIKADTITGDITDRDSLCSIVKNFDYVIHTAGLTTDWAPKNDFYSANIAGTLNILEACKINGIKNVIITGSVSSYGEENCCTAKDETFPFNSRYNYFMEWIFPCRMNYYRDSKAIMTQKANEYAHRHNLNLTIIEPVFVYGEREFSSGFYEYVKTVKEGSRLFPGSKRNKFHIIYAGELAKSYFKVYKKRLPGVQRFIIGNKTAENMDKIYSLFCTESNLKPPKKIPKWMIYPPAFICELFYTIFKSRKAPLLTRGRINMFYDNIEFSVKKAKDVLGFKTELPIEESIRKTVTWYKDNGYF